MKAISATQHDTTHGHLVTWWEDTLQRYAARKPKCKWKDEFSILGAKIQSLHLPITHMSDQVLLAVKWPGHRSRVRCRSWCTKSRPHIRTCVSHAGLNHLHAFASLPSKTYIYNYKHKEQVQHPSTSNLPRQVTQEKQKVRK